MKVMKIKSPNNGGERVPIGHLFSPNNFCCKYEQQGCTPSAPPPWLAYAPK